MHVINANGAAIPALGLGTWTLHDELCACRLQVGGGELLAAPAVSAAASRGKSAGQVVLRWHVQQESVAAIPRSMKKERLAEDFAFTATCDLDAWLYLPRWM